MDSKLPGHKVRRLPGRNRKLSLRRYRFVGLSRRIWRRRAIFIAGAVLIGMTAVAFAELADDAQTIYAQVLLYRPWLPVVIMPLGFAGLAYVTRRWFPSAAGSGIPQVIAARATSDRDHRIALLGWKTMLAKVIMTTLALAIGASVGREGPTVQLGASIMLVVATIAGIGRQNGLVLAGSAAGIAAAFNAPIAGILFVIEEIAKSFAGRINEIVIGSVVIAGGVSTLLVGNHAYFGEVPAALTDAQDWIAVPVCAAFAGISGGLFSVAVIMIARGSPQLPLSPRNRPILFAALCGLAVAMLSISTSGFASGNGYGETRAELLSGDHMPWWFGLSKLIATMLSSLSGIPGGLFSPSLAVGAALGSMLTPLLTHMDPRALIVLMTAGYFAAVAQSPLTAVVIVMEMTGKHDLAIPMMATALFAAGISRMISREPLYHALARNYLFASPPPAAAN